MTTDADTVLVLTWEDIEAIVDRLANEVRAGAVPQRLVAVSRGGLVPAVLIAHRLGMRHIDVVHAATTVDDRPHAAKVRVRLMVPDDTWSSGQTALIAEDIVGSGRTLRAVSSALVDQGIRVDALACVVNERNWETSNDTEIQHHVRHIGQRVRSWVTFPWERT